MWAWTYRDVDWFNCLGRLTIFDLFRSFGLLTSFRCVENYFNVDKFALSVTYKDLKRIFQTFTVSNEQFNTSKNRQIETEKSTQKLSIFTNQKNANTAASFSLNWQKKWILFLKWRLRFLHVLYMNIWTSNYNYYFTLVIILIANRLFRRFFRLSYTIDFLLYFSTLYFVPYFIFCLN